MADLERERHGHVEVLRINRPEVRNALSPEVIRGIGTGVAEADADPEVAAIVVTGTGDRAFCAGMDLRGFSARRRPGDGGGDAPSEPQESVMEGYQHFIRHGASKPVIAAANGSAVAGGFELLLACDLAVAASGATFGLPEVKRGLFPAGGGIFLSRRIPMAMALELTLTGDTITADQALALGLVNRVVPAEEVLESAIALAERIACNGPLAVRAIKQLVRAAASEPSAAVWEQQDRAVPAVFSSEDAREGANAFLERRPPVWLGR